ncbi:hypothetical protein MTo_02538 [Microcystis aeruginosa NIES-1211]|uniref:hypothetical protein n=1 Tax=Microcystis TaxID=1125 RepID=UPI000D7C534E|nr:MULTISPECIES: hypothetical protein [Microcystis]MCA2718416.1 hypothetical protein [Microcystis sp. M169S2]GBL15226.1 hypothetical protein MTo_02538 [Microcystis aeruginosa NIES-1211]GCA85148.1 hypothetical protein MiHa_03126 [Microcystis aeruginosa NIES-2522]
MQAIEFKTILKNGIVSIPAEYSSEWEGKQIRVILLDNAEKILPVETTDINPLKGSVTFDE